MDWLTTSTILERLKRLDDRSVWTGFHERFRRPLLAFARKGGLRDADAADVVQETLAAFIQAYKEGQYDRAKGRLSRWLFGIAYQQIANFRRRLRQEALRQRQQGETFWTEVSGSERAEEVWDAEWEASALEDSLRQVRTEVSDRTFEAFDRIVRQRQSTDLVSRDLEMTRDAVYVAKHRVLRRLAERLQEYEHFQAP